MPKRRSIGKLIKPTSKELSERLGRSEEKVKPEPPTKKLSRRQRAKLKNAKMADEELNSIIPNNPRPNHEGPRGRGDSGGLLTQPSQFKNDIKLVENSIKKGWNVRRKQMIRRRLEDILVKTTGDMNTKDGIVSSETVADKLAIDAAKVLVTMDAQDMTRIKNGKPDVPGTVVNVTNNVLNNGFDARTIELARLAFNIGARELTVSGRSIPIQEILGTVDRVPTQEGSE